MELQKIRVLYNTLNVPYQYYYNGPEEVRKHFEDHQMVIAAYYLNDQTCYFRKDKVDVYVAVHELAHALHHRIDGDKFKLLESSTLEAFADAVSYVVLSKFIEVSDFTNLIQRIKYHSKDIYFIRSNYPWFDSKVLTVSQDIVNILNNG